MESHFRISLLAVALLIASFLRLASAARPAAGTTGTEFIRTSCSATAYPDLCFSSLSIHASAIQLSPKLLAHAALSVSIDSARATSRSADIVRLSKAARMTPRETGTMHDCMEELGDTVDRLSSSMVEMDQINGSNFGFMMSDIQTWVSATLIDEDTCTEGFAGNTMAGGVKTSVRAQIVNVAHVTNNALALINSYASLHG